LSTTDGDEVGGLVGVSEGYLFDDHIAGTLKTTRRMEVGGLAGLEYSGGVRECSADVKILMGANAGALVGGLNSGTVEQSYATGKVTGYNAGGGLVGGAYDASINNSYSTAAVTTEASQSAVGGLVGYDPQYGYIERS